MKTHSLLKFLVKGLLHQLKRMQVVIPLKLSHKPNRMQEKSRKQSKTRTLKLILLLLQLRKLTLMRKLEQKLKLELHFFQTKVLKAWLI
jgi:hypothetical protein